jgi:sensor c-di-GMP phosphodiesterase-like protein
LYCPLPIKRGILLGLSMSMLKHRVSITLAAALIGAGCGVLGGYLLGRAHSVRLAQGQVSADAAHVLVEVNVFSQEAHSSLATMNASAGPICSESELAGFRKLLLRTQYLIDVGRIRDGKILCSAALGTRDLPAESFVPLFTQPDGSKVYRDMTLYRTDNRTPATLQSGDSFVVFRSTLHRYLSATAIRHTTTAVDAPTGKAGWVGGSVPMLQGATLTKDSQGRVGNVLYGTRCETAFNNCVTSYI